MLITQDRTANPGLVGHNQLLGCHIHDNGRKSGHGVYIESSDNTIADSTIDHNGGYGVHLFSGEVGVVAGDTVNVARNTVAGNRIYANGFGASGRPGYGGAVTVWYGDGNAVYNNLLYGNSGAGAQIDRGSSNTLFINNAIYGNQGAGDFRGIEIGANGAVISVTVEGNISDGNVAGDYINRRANGSAANQ